MKVIGQLIVGAVLASLIIMSLNYWNDRARHLEPSERWMTVSKLEVADHQVGEDAVVILNREILQNFTASWIAEVHEQQEEPDRFARACWGNGINDYAQGETLPTPLKLSWFMGVKCNLKAGRYRLCGTWRIWPMNYPDKILRFCSPVFRVKEYVHGGG